VLGSLFQSFTDALGKRFFLTTWLPSLLLVGAILAEVVAAAGVPRTIAWVESFPVIAQAAGVALILLVVTFVASLVSVNTTNLLQLCEGYWGSGWVHRRFGCPRRAYYQAVIAKLSDSNSDADYAKIYKRFPPKDYLNQAMPTRVGNILISSELYPKARYGIDAVLVWPRLYQAAPDTFRNVLAAARSDMDQMVSLMTGGLAFAAIGTVTALVLLPWYAAPLCFVAGIVLAILSYHGLVSACVPYAETVRTGFDVYRNSLLTAVGWNAAPSLAAERYQWTQIGNLWFRGSPGDPAALGYQPFRASFRVPKDAPPFALVKDTAPDCAHAKAMPHLWRGIIGLAAAIAVIAGLLGAARERVIPVRLPGPAVVVAAKQLHAFSAIRPAQLKIQNRGWTPFMPGLATTKHQVTGHVLLSDVPAGQPVQVSQIGPVIPPGTVALSAVLSPAESPAAHLSPGDRVNVTPACKGHSGLSGVKVLDVREKTAASGAPPQSMTVVLAVPANVAEQTASTLLSCKVAFTPAS
jgi:hypothetical protein